MPFDPRSTPRLFHGTLEPLEGPLRPGGYDGVFWTAEHSAVAQCYMATGGVSMVRIPSFHLDDYVRPDDHTLHAIARLIGPAAQDVEYDWRGQAKSWRVPTGYARNRDVVAHIEGVLGYTSQTDAGGDRIYEIRTDGLDPTTREPVIVPAGYSKPGSLVIVEGFQDMRFFDLSTGESDLTDRQYHRLGTFRRLESQGFDGVVIDDFCQSKTWGNVGHRSIGFFAHAIARLRTVVIPAVRFDWGEGGEDLQVLDTPEYLGWRAEREQAEERPRMRVAA